MPTLLEREISLRSKLETNFSNIIATPTEELMRKEELGSDYNFGCCETLFLRIRDLYSELNSADTTNCSIGTLDNLRSASDDILKGYSDIRSFSFAVQSDTAKRHKDIIDALERFYDRAYETALPLLAYSGTRPTNLILMQNRLNSEIDLFKSEIVREIEEVKQQKKDAVRVVEEIRTESLRLGVSKYGSIFSEAADQHQISAIRWLRASITMAAGTIAVSFLFLYIWSTDPTMNNTARAIQFTISKLVILSILISGAYWCGRTYKAHMHNVVVNRHRQNALETFMVFASASEDPITKNAVVLQATSCIFAPQLTGHISGDGDASTMPQILEIVRGVDPRGITK